MSVAVWKLANSGTLIHFTPQVARESWSVATRPADVGGYALTLEMADAILERAHQGLRFLHDTPDIYTIWRELLKRHRVSGKQVHDAYHAAAMLAHGISHVLTLDDRDFKRYSEITPIHPQDV